MKISAFPTTGLRWITERVARITAMVLFAAALTGCVHRPQPAFTFVQMCDPQLGFGGYDADVARFRQAVKQINELHSDFVVICGDLVNGVEEKSCGGFDAVKKSMQMPCYCAPGNHDVGNKPSPGTLARYREWAGKDYYSFTHRGYEFVVVNSQLWVSAVPGESERQDTWLKQTLQAVAKRRHPIFVIDHYPLFVKEPNESDEYFNVPKAKRQELLQLFQQSGVVAVLSGHTHTTNIREFGGIQMVASQTTSKNFDRQPYGFRLWHIGGRRPFQNDFVPLE
jgi:serine/threonine-protein phosphatase CPPED1